MPQRNKKRGFTKEIKIGEEVRIAVNLKLEHFRNNDDEKGKINFKFRGDEIRYLLGV